MPKELSVLTVFEQHRSELYWKQYTYCVTMIQPKIDILRGGLEQTQVDKSIGKRKYWEGSVYGASKHSVYSEQIRSDLLTTALYFKNSSDQFKLIFAGSSHLSLYTNSLQLVESLVAAATAQTLPIKIKTVKKCLLTVAPDTIILNDPKHKFRTYFKEITITAQAVGQLKVWLQQQQQANEIKCSSSVESYLLTHGHYHTRSHWYIDHNSNSYETMIGMISPGLVRKTINLQRR